MKWGVQKNYYNIQIAIHAVLLALVIAVGCIKYNKMKKKNILLPIDKTVGYITTEEICKDGFELIGFFDGNNVYKKKENE